MRLCVSPLQPPAQHDHFQTTSAFPTPIQPVPFLIALLLFSFPPRCPDAAGQEQDPRKVSVETGLSPAFQVQGRPPVLSSIQERMAHFRVPGVSIAVLDGGRLAGAEGYEASGGGPSVPQGSPGRPGGRYLTGTTSDVDLHRDSLASQSSQDLVYMVLASGLNLEHDLHLSHRDVGEAPPVMDVEDVGPHPGHEGREPR